MNSSFKAEGIVIKLVDFPEADKLIGIVTKDHGFIELVAKGIKRPTSRKSPHLDLINLVQIEVARGHSPQIITQAELIESFTNIKADLKLTRTTLYITELLNSLLALEVEDQSLFISLKNYLTALNQNPDDDQLRKLSTDFQLYLLDHLGFPRPKQLTPQGLINHFETLINKKIKSKEILL